MNGLRGIFRGLSLMSAYMLLATPAPAQVARGVHGRVVDPQGRPLAGATVSAVDELTGDRATRTTDPKGNFSTHLPGHGFVDLLIQAPGYSPLKQTVHRQAGEGTFRLTLPGSGETVTVVANTNDTTLFAPDPSQQVLVHEDLLDANPGRPGAPISIPGIPVETASGGIKAPQYFVPGVAGTMASP